MCISEDSEFEIQANHVNHDKFITPYLTVVECKGPDCASPEEI